MKFVFIGTKQTMIKYQKIVSNMKIYADNIRLVILKRKKQVIISLLSLIVLYSLFSFFYNPVQSKTRFIMDTYCTIQIPGNKKALKIIDETLTRMEEIDNKFDAHTLRNPVYEFNNNNTPISDREIVNLAKTAISMSEQTAGAYDITVFPLMELWGFYSDSLGVKTSPQKVPDTSEIEKVLRNVGYENILVVNNQLIKLKKNTKIDFGSIAKGYAVGEALKVLKNNGVKSALIDAGGEIYALGKNKRKPWKIGIRNPRGESPKDVIGVLELENMTAVTSGDYERYFEENGVRYCHIIDPKTGYPAKELQSITVIIDNPMEGDALSTALFVLGKDNALKFASENKFKIIMVTSGGEILKSEGFDLKTTINKGR
jgi:FAD:protein FMN transferase